MLQNHDAQFLSWHKICHDISLMNIISFWNLMKFHPQSSRIKFHLIIHWKFTNHISWMDGIRKLPMLEMKLWMKVECNGWQGNNLQVQFYNLYTYSVGVIEYWTILSLKINKIKINSCKKKWVMPLVLLEFENLQIVGFTSGISQFLDLRCRRYWILHVFFHFKFN